MDSLCYLNEEGQPPLRSDQPVTSIMCERYKKIKLYLQKRGALMCLRKTKWTKEAMCKKCTFQIQASR